MRDTLTDYFYWRDGENKEWHIWDVEMWADGVFLSSKDRLDPHTTDYYHPSKAIIQDVVEGSGLGISYSHGVRGDDEKYGLPVGETTLTISEGTDHLGYIYNHAIAHGYLNDDRHKGLYMNPHPIGGRWPQVAATVQVPENVGLAEVKWNTMVAMEQVLGQTQVHLPWIDCIWFHYPHQSYDTRIENPSWCDGHTEIMKTMSRQTTKCDVCGKWVSALIYPRRQLATSLFADDTYWVKCPFCKTTREELPDIDVDIGTSIPQAIEHATHYCPNCHNFRRTEAELLQGNENKMVLSPWGAKVYLSQATLAMIAAGSLGGAGGAAFESWLIESELQRRASWAAFRYLKLIGPGSDLPGGIPNPDVITKEWGRQFFHLENIKYIAGQLTIIFSAVFAAALLSSVIFNSGVVLYILWPPLPSAIILPQRPGFDVPVCVNCQRWTMPNPSIPASETDINPYVGMNYGDGGFWMPDYISRPSLPDEADEKYPPGYF